MSKNIEISEIDLAPLTEFYLGKWHRLSQEIAGVEKTLAQLGVNPKLIAATKNNIEHPKFPKESNSDFQVFDKDYPLKAKWIEKCKYILEVIGSATATQIIKVIRDNEPSKKESKGIVATISGILAEEVKKENGIVTRKENEKGNFEYSLKQH